MVKFRANKEQQEAINIIDRPLLISAGPGTGKTATLVNRFVNMVKNHNINPKNILIATFTEKAAKELITRISNEIKDFDINEVYIGTFHSICLRIIEENIAYIPNLRKNFILMDEFEQQYFIYKNYNKYLKDIINSATFIDNTYFSWDDAGTLKSFLNILSDEMIDYKDLIKDNDKDIACIGKIKEKYNEILKKENKIDFATLQETVLKLLEENKEVLNKYQNLFKYMMIDEYQDTNKIQEKLVFKLSKTKNICVVGDDDQSLYRFRGAIVRNILEFPKRFPTDRCKEVKLNTNYRSSPKIIDFYNKWMTEYTNDDFEWEEYRIPKKIKSNKKEVSITTPSVLKIIEPFKNNWYERICTFIKNLKIKGYINDYNQVAFLCSSVKTVKIKAMANYFESHGVPVNIPRANMFFEREEITLAIGLLLNLFTDVKEHIFNKKDSSEKYYKFKFSKTNPIIYYINSVKLAENLMEKDLLLKEWFNQRKKELNDPNKNTNYTFSNLLYQLFAFEYFENILKTDVKSSSYDQRALRNLSKLTNIISNFEVNNKVEIIGLNASSFIPKRFFNTFLFHQIESNLEEYEDEKEYAPKGSISIMTIHQSKGLEFPIVIVDSLYDKIWNNNSEILDKLYTKYTDKYTYEEKSKIPYFDFLRKYYVAFSRAESLLVLTSDAYEYRGQKAPSDLFKKALEDIEEYNSNIHNFDDFYFGNVKESNLKETYSFTRDILKYENCSLGYKIFEKLGFSKVKIESTLFGSLVHQTIEDIHDAILKGEEKTISEKISKWYEENYQSLILTENAYLDEKIKNIGLSYVKNYFEKAKDIWGNIKESEIKLSYTLDDYILVGQVDMIRGDEDNVEIIDFKTGKKPNVNEDDQTIKMYEKQLLVYAYLVEKKFNVNVSKMKLYYIGDDNPIISFNNNRQTVGKMMKNFSNIVTKIEDKDFNTKANDKKLCNNCDLRYFCKISNPLKTKK